MPLAVPQSEHQFGPLVDHPPIARQKRGAWVPLIPNHDHLPGALQELQPARQVLLAPVRWLAQVGERGGEGNRQLDTRQAHSGVPPEAQTGDDPFGLVSLHRGSCQVRLSRQVEAWDPLWPVSGDYDHRARSPLGRLPHLLP